MPAEPIQVALILDAADGGCTLRELRFPEDAVGPVDFAWSLQAAGDFLCIGSGVLAGSVLPGSNRLIVAGRSPLWGGFYVSTLGGGSLIWDGTGLSFLAIGGRAPQPSVLVLTGARDGYPKARLEPVPLERVWAERSRGPGGFYALQRHALERFDGQGTPRVLAVGPAARATRYGAIGSSKTRRGRITPIDCWAGRGGFGSKLLQDHNICAVVYGGDYEDEDLSDRAEADGYFQRRFSKKMKLVDLEATTKYRYDPQWRSGGTFGVNYSKLTDLMLSFNYRSVDWPRDERHALWQRLVRDHYLRQFNEETIAERKQSQCGEPCPAVCKKYWGDYKKDYEPYQTMGPLIGVFDQRVAERVNHHADALGFDGIQIGGVLAWVMDCLDAGLTTTAELELDAAVPSRPVFAPEGFDPVADSEHNGRLALALLDKCAEPGHLLAGGMRAAARALGPGARARAVYLANGDAGWMVPNQYWVPGMFAPGAIMGKYYVYYKFDYRPPRELGRLCARRMVAELTTDNAGMCRFHRGWSERIWADIVCGHLNVELDYPGYHTALARRIHAQGAPVYWESARLERIIHAYLRAVREDSPDDADLGDWLWRFDQDRPAAARAYWDELRGGIDEGMAAPAGEGCR
jgi:glyceraldehyde-3-phosphate dehydrogenase (ferredoxin)